MNEQQIKKLALANGFKLKEQANGNMDLNPYVYDFARALMQTAQQQWIPVAERLPDIGVSVMAGAYRDDEFQWHFYERYEEDGFWMWARHVGDLYSDCELGDYTVTHWQPLLPPPVQEGE